MGLWLEAGLLLQQRISLASDYATRIPTSTNTFCVIARPLWKRIVKTTTYNLLCRAAARLRPDLARTISGEDGSCLRVLLIDETITPRPKRASPQALLKASITISPAKPISERLRELDRAE